MNVPIRPASIAPAPPNELDELLSAISDAIDGLLTWDITNFQSAVERQSAICNRIALRPGLNQLAATTAPVRKIQDLNRVYERLLQHSVHWLRTIHHILQASGDSFPRRASVHFRG